jgi:hypothetical protein
MLPAVYMPTPEKIPPVSTSASPNPTAVCIAVARSVMVNTPASTNGKTLGVEGITQFS